MNLLQVKPRAKSGQRSIIELQKAERSLKEGAFREVEQFCLAVLEEQPDSAQACQLMAELRLKERRFDECMGWVRRARDIERDHPRSLNILGRVLVHRGDLEGAEAAFRTAIEGDADYADALANLAALLLRTDRPTEAEQLARRALQHDRNHGVANLALGQILFDQQRPDLAVPHLQAGIQRELTHRPAQFTLAVALQQLGRIDEAVTAYRRLIAAGDTDPVVFSKAAAVLEAMGELDSATAGYEAALEMAPGDPAAAAGLAGIMTISDQADQALAMLAPLVELGDAPPCLHIAHARALHAMGRADEALSCLVELTRRPAPEGELVPAWFLLGELLHARGDFDRAFAHFRRAKQLTRGRYDAALQESIVTRLINTFTREMFDRAPRGSESELPVFIIGLPRSGGSVVERIIAAHPRGRGIGALPHIALGAARMGRYNNMGFGYPECVNVLRERDLREMSAAYLARVFNEGLGARRAADSMWRNVFHVGLLELMFPYGRLIHCTRSPLDAGLGCYFRAFRDPGEPFANDLANFGHYYAQYQRLMAHWRNTTALPILEFDFDALLRDQEGETRRLLDFLGLPWDPACLAFHERPGLVRSASHVRLRQPLQRSELGWALNYDKHLGPLRESLAAAGYPVD